MLESQKLVIVLRKKSQAPKSISYATSFIVEKPGRYSVSLVIKVNITSIRTYWHHEPFDMMTQDHFNGILAKKCIISLQL